MSGFRLARNSRPDAVPEGKAAVLGAAYHYIIFDCHEAQKHPAAGQSGRGLNDGTEVKGDSTDAPIISN